jgi:hypothetical protein
MHCFLCQQSHLLGNDLLFLQLFKQMCFLLCSCLSPFLKNLDQKYFLL